MAWVIPLSFASGVVFDLLFAAFRADIQEYIIIPQLSGFLIGVFISIYVTKEVLVKTFKGYRIALIKVEDSAEEDI